MDEQGESSWFLLCVKDEGCEGEGSRKGSEQGRNGGVNAGKVLVGG